MSGFGGKRALVTGAGKGIGRSVVQRLCAHGASVLALSRTQADLESLAAETGCDILVAEIADIEATLAALRSHGIFELLVNNAGISRLAPFLTTTQADFDAVLAVNVAGPLRIAQHVAAGLIAAGRGGAIVNVSSIAAHVGLADHAAYCASKGALDALTRVMAVELGPHGIRANSVNPTVTLTPMAERAWSDEVKAAPVRARIPLGRFLQPTEIADAICYLLGDGAAMINGVCLPVDGGFSAA